MPHPIGLPLNLVELFVGVLLVEFLGEELKRNDALDLELLAREADLGAEVSTIL